MAYPTETKLEEKLEIRENYLNNPRVPKHNYIPRQPNVYSHSESPEIMENYLDHELPQTNQPLRAQFGSGSKSASGSKFTSGFEPASGSKSASGSKPAYEFGSGPSKPQ